MKNKDIKLIATDMDGTFLNDQHQYDQDLLRKVLASCKEKDIYFAAASGRALLSLKSLFKGFEDQIIFIAEKWQRGGISWRRSLRSDHVQRLLFGCF